MKLYFKYISQKQNKKTFEKKVSLNNPFKVLKNLNFVE